MEQGKLNLDDPVEKYGIKLDSPLPIRVKHLFSHTSEFRPGAYYKYNGKRFLLLGKVIEAVTGESFKDLLIKKIISPLGMKETAPGGKKNKALYKSVLANLAAPYLPNKKNIPVKSTYPDHFSCAAGLISSVLDMAKYDIAIDENKFLTPKLQKLAFTPAKSTVREKLPYGLGWFSQVEKVLISPGPDSLRIIWHYGYWNCNSSLILKIPAYK
ncbi:MAG: beta-lactamase family protein, partial [bacterium]|nr:beta-lactamase family protein [bacterium]